MLLDKAGCFEALKPAGATGVRRWLFGALNACGLSNSTSDPGRQLGLQLEKLVSAAPVLEELYSDDAVMRSTEAHEMVDLAMGCLGTMNFSLATVNPVAEKQRRQLSLRLKAAIQRQVHEFVPAPRPVRTGRTAPGDLDHMQRALALALVRLRRRVAASPGGPRSACGAVSLSRIAVAQVVETQGALIQLVEALDAALGPLHCVAPHCVALRRAAPHRTA